MRLLRYSVQEAASSIVAAQLKAAGDGAERLRNPRDKEALHDFRVGIRRLRSALRAYRPWLGKAASRKVRGALRDIAQDTNRDRDAEVQAVWIRASRSDAPAEVRAELGALLRRFGRRRQPRRKLVQAFASAEKKLHRRLRKIEPGGPPFREIYACLVAEYVAEAAQHRSTLLRVEQVDEAHKMRIAVKRLRYLLEPLAPEVPTLSERIEALGTLQNLLGELHDAQVFAEQNSHKLGPSIGDASLRFLTTRNDARRKRAFELLQTQWLDGGANALFSDISRLIPCP